MTRSLEPTGTPSQPALADLLSRYLQQQGSHVSDTAEPGGEVIPHEAVPAQPVNARLAWDEAVAVLQCFAPADNVDLLPQPSDWTMLVANQEPAAALAYCVGNYPQLVRDLQPLLQADRLTLLLPSAGRPSAEKSLLDWSLTQSKAGKYPQILVALGVLRLARQFDAAAELRQRHEATVPSEWQAAWANEHAALAWHSGQTETAQGLWQAQASSLPILFNRGMAALFLDKPAEAHPVLKRAVAQLAEESAWHHLACLYLALAEMRR